ncbi:MAG: tetraacyldisaccharide 4'-kinase [Acidobacteriota bacterium]|jgi:tetraacyldisaccharide 4'-kinase|nr:tetraacyldisaccharide 4'-kinase [Acidobacteriota bacterium]
MARFLNIIAAPFSLLYKSAAWLQRRLRARRRTETPGIFVISVDGIAFGGSGKTPMVIRVGRELQRLGIAFAVITRGYGSRLEKRGARLDPENHGPADVGDEACLIQRNLASAPIWVGRDRRASLQAAAQQQIPVAILDDGFQSTHIRRDLCIMLDDPDRHWSRLRQFPRLMREADLRLARAGAVRAPRVPAHAAFSFRITGFFDARGTAHTLAGDAVFAFSALGDNRRFRRDLDGLDLRGFRGFRDHHVYTRSDLLNLERRARARGARFLVCTEKDFIKAAPLAGGTPPLLYAANEIQLDMDLGDYLRRNVPTKT